MGRKIDRMIGYALLFTGGFIYFLYAWRNLYAAAACAVPFFIFAKKMIDTARGRFGQKLRSKRKQHADAEKQVRGWPFAPEDQVLREASRAIVTASGLEAEELVGDRYEKPDGERVSFTLIQNHPDGLRTDANELLRIWKAHAERDCDTLVIINTGAFDEKARDMAKTLKAPALRLIDCTELIEIVMKSGADIGVSADPTRAVSYGSRWKTVARRLSSMSKRSAWRNALYGAVLMALYFFIGINTYLVLSLLLLALAAIGMRRPKERHGLL